MGLHKIHNGLDLPICGEPDRAITDGARPRRVALIAGDYPGLRASMRVAVGDAVVRGSVLFDDERMPGVRHTAPGAGMVAAVHCGADGALQSVVVGLNERECAGEVAAADEARFETYTGKHPAGLNPEQVKALLLESGLWTALRARPFGKVADPQTAPHSLFITAMDTNPLAPPVDVVYQGNEGAFEKGLICLTRLTEGKLFLCKAPGSAITAGPYSGISVEEFDGVHPAGNAGTHIHCLDPVHRGKTVWHVGYQDVIAIGKLFETGRLDVARVVSLAEPGVSRPRLLRTRLGASTDDLVAGELVEGELRVVSGSVLSGRAAGPGTACGEALSYLGRYHSQISVLREGRDDELLDWLTPGRGAYTLFDRVTPLLLGKRPAAFTTAQHGAQRAMLSFDVDERVTPLDILPAFLVQALMAGDLKRAEELGCLELDEEDLALCAFVSPSKIDYAPLLRQALTRLDEGTSEKP